jgi:hypothetical protein
LSGTTFAIVQVVIVIPVFFGVGIAAVFRTRELQAGALRRYEKRKKKLGKYDPRLIYVDSEFYIIQMRIGGLLCIVVSLVLLYGLVRYLMGL